MDLRLCGGVAGLVTRVMTDRSSVAAMSATLPERVSRPQSVKQEPHYVTPRQLVASLETSERQILPLTATNDQGAAESWDELSSDRPVVFVFIKAKCPCSVEFQPYFHRVHAAYGSHVRLVGVIDGSVAAAKAYILANRVPFPILADEDCTLFRKFKVTNGAYVALVDRGGRIDSLWPGCSVEMMQHLGERICLLTGCNVQAVDYAGLPGALTSGCPIGG